MDLFDIFDFIISPILDLFVHKMPLEVWLKQLLLNILGLVCLTVVFFGWGKWFLMLPGIAGTAFFFWRSHRVYMDWVSEWR